MAAASKARKEAGERASRGGRRATGQPAAAKTAEPAAADRANGTVEEAALEPLLEALIAARNGDFSIRLPARRRGIIGELAAAYNDYADTNARLKKEVVRVGRVIGREGRMAER